jgi:hypothetical protein
MRWAASSATCSCSHDVLLYLTTVLKAMEPANHKLKSLKSWVKINLSFLKKFLLSHFITLVKSWLTHTAIAIAVWLRGNKWAQHICLQGSSTTTKSANTPSGPGHSRGCGWMQGNQESTQSWLCGGHSRAVRDWEAKEVGTQRGTGGLKYYHSTSTEVFQCLTNDNATVMPFCWSRNTQKKYNVSCICN